MEWETSRYGVRERQEKVVLANHSRCRHVDLYYARVPSG